VLKVYLGCFCSIKGFVHQGVILCFTVLVGLVDSIQVEGSIMLPYCAILAVSIIPRSLEALQHLIPLLDFK
jgi:hypothetical protein